MFSLRYVKDVHSVHALCRDGVFRLFTIYDLEVKDPKTGLFKVDRPKSALAGSVRFKNSDTGKTQRLPGEATWIALNLYTFEDLGAAWGTGGIVPNVELYERQRVLLRALNNEQAYDIMTLLDND